MASASAWRGIVVLAFLDKAKTKFPLQSRATTAIDEKFGPIAASQFTLMVPREGAAHVVLIG
jgi:hypothetical protein